jgi:ABC-type Fe3+/spermidine/putrescine transport system ATPase subunit
MIEFAKVTKSHGSRLVLDAFDLNVGAGERVVLSGPSGCGKTTILRLIAGFIAPDAGRVSLAGKVASQDGRILVPPERRALGYVFQDLALWPHMSVFENVEFPLKVQGLSSEERSHRVGAMLSMVQLDSLGKAYPSTLSGGEQQRVAIARALIARPAALLMDEPLSNLDDGLRKALCDRILALHQKLAFALVYVTHSRDEIRQLDARTVLLGGSKAKPDADL